MTPSAQGWRSLLVAYGITSTIEAIGVSQIFAYLPLRLREIGLPDADIPAFTGIFTSLIFVFGIVLVPFCGGGNRRLGRLSGRRLRLSARWARDRRRGRARPPSTGRVIRPRRD